MMAAALLMWVEEGERRQALAALGDLLLDTITERRLHKLKVDR